MNKEIIKLQDQVLSLLSGKLKGFYLGGGTALSKFYFQHRTSEDLDFFTQDFNAAGINKICEEVKSKFKIKLIAETVKPNQVRIAVYHVNGLKVDFIEDYLRLLCPLKTINGIPALSLEDIYLRKIYTLIGTLQAFDLIGRKEISGRQEPKDFYDVYFLSHTFLPLSRFAEKYCEQPQKEGLIRWFRTYSRLDMQSGLLDLGLLKEKRLDYKKIENHFKEEIDNLIEEEIN